MKTKLEIESMIKQLDEKRMNELRNRDEATNETDRSVAQNLVTIYAMQQIILEEVLR